MGVPNCRRSMKDWRALRRAARRSNPYRSSLRRRPARADRATRTVAELAETWVFSILSELAINARLRGPRRCALRLPHLQSAIPFRHFALVVLHRFMELRLIWRLGSERGCQ